MEVNLVRLCLDLIQPAGVAWEGQLPKKDNMCGFRERKKVVGKKNKRERKEKHNGVDRGKERGNGVRLGVVVGENMLLSDSGGCSARWELSHRKHFPP